MTELIWEGKYDENGRRMAPLRVSLPFQTIETVNESAQQRQMALDLFSAGRDLEWRKLSETLPFPYSRPTLSATKTVYNLVPCGNEFEKAFAKFLEDAPDVARFAKLPEQFGFAIEYTDSNNNLRYYEPDFVAVLSDDTHHLVETKGREDVDVANKDRAAILWCENATRLTGTMWQYVKVPQKEYEKLHPDEFADLTVFEQTPML